MVLPSFDDMEEKVEFDLNISFDASYGVIANGTAIMDSKDVPNNQRGANSIKDAVHSDSIPIAPSITWHFDMEHPMSSYLLAFAIGKYN